MSRQLVLRSGVISRRALHAAKRASRIAMRATCTMLQALNIPAIMTALIVPTMVLALIIPTMVLALMTPTVMTAQDVPLLGTVQWYNQGYDSVTRRYDYTRTIDHAVAAGQLIIATHTERGGHTGILR